MRTNCFTVVELDDGGLRTAAPGFFNWQLSLDDTDDADQDGIPDFSDDPPPTPATLRIMAPRG